MDANRLLSFLLEPFQRFLDPSDRLGYIYMLSALVVAIAVYIHTQASRGKLQPAGLIKWLLPMEVLRHPSAQTDFVYFYVNKLLQAAIYGAIIVGAPAVATATTQLLTAVFGPAGPGFAPNVFFSVLMTFTMVAVTDMALWYLHYLFHVIPVLWEFHKVHHSAEVMTPITAARMHPVEEIIDAIAASTALGISYAIMVYLLGPAAHQYTMFELNVIVAAFFLAAFNLRHSHVWVRYPTWLQHILICPAQHQIHHSTAPRHWDRNMGFVFALWDWMAGTLYAPRTKEEITFGLGNAEDGGAWHSVGALYLRPFRQAYALLRSESASNSPEDQAENQADEQRKDTL